MTSDEIKYSKISDYCEIIAGFAFKSKDLENQGIPVIKIANISDDFRVKLSSTQQYFPHEMFTKKHEKYVLENRDIIIAMTGAKVGKIGRVRNNSGELTLLNQRVAKISCNDIDADYLWAAIRMPGYNRFFSDLAIGAAQPNMSAKQIGSVEVPVFPKDKEIKIGQISNNFDSLVETQFDCREICQQIISALFCSWFIDFDPVQAKVEGKLPYGMDEETAALFPDSFEDSELGPIPTGWNIGRIGDIADISSGKHQPERSELESSEYCTPLLGGAGIIAWTTESLFDEPIIVIGRVGTLGVVKKYTSPVWPSDNTLIFKTHHNSSFHYLLHQLRLQDFGAYNRGSTQPLLTQSDMGKLKLLIPNEDILMAFEEKIRSMTLLSDISKDQSEILTKTRDTLLPWLIFGELKVPMEA